MPHPLTRARAHRWVVLLPALVLLLGACVSPSPEPAAGSADPIAGPTPGTAVAGELAVVITGLRGPTQIAHHPDGRLLVAEIGDGEGTPTGTVTAIDLAEPNAREVLVEGLNTPTGVTVADGQLWIMEPARLLRAPLAGGEPAVVFDDMPNNGRSNGTIITMDDGSLLFDTAGRRRGFDPAPNSGTLWLMDPTDLPAPDGSEGYGRPVLTGMKHAYAAVELGAGRLAVTEMSDGRFDGSPAPDEVVVVDLAAETPPTGGWPRCIGDRVPVAEFDGTAELCDQAIASVALFDPGATPTGITVAADGTLLVALWNRDQVVAVNIDAADPASAVTIVADGVARPQHLLRVADRTLVTSHADGTVLALECCGG